MGDVVSIILLERLNLLIIFLALILGFVNLVVEVSLLFHPAAELIHDHLDSSKLY